MPRGDYTPPEVDITKVESYARISELTGDECTASSSNSTTDSANRRIELDPGITGPGAWALYRFEDIYAGDEPLRIDVALDPSFIPEELYVGIADYGSNRWRWFEIGMPATINAVDVPEDIRPINGWARIHAVVYCIGTKTTYLTRIRLGSSSALNDVTGFAATDGIHNDRVHLSWEQPEMADGYIIEYRCEGGAPEEWTSLVVIDNAETTGFDHRVDGDLPAEQLVVYEYRIKATYEDELSRNWAVDYGSMVFEVSGFKASDGLYENRIELTWDALVGAEAYEIQYGRGTWATLATITDGAITEFRHTTSSPAGMTVEPLVIYEYRIEPLLNVQHTYNWSYDSGHAGTIPPPQVTGFSASDGLSEDRISLTWDTVEEASGYLIEVADADSSAPEEWGTLVSINGNGVTEFEHTVNSPPGHEAEPLKLYHYRIKARTGEVLGNAWAIDYGYAGDRTPSDVRSLTASDGTHYTEICLSWEMVPEADAYHLEYRNASGGVPVDWTELIVVNDGAATEYVHSEIEPDGREIHFGSMYDYRIKAAASGITSLNWTADSGFSGGVQSFKGTHGDYEDRIELSWEAYPGADRFILEYRDAAGVEPPGWQMLAEILDGGETGFMHTAVLPAGEEASRGVVYDYRIRTEIAGVFCAGWSGSGGFRGMGAGDWPMAGHDGRQTRRSERTGPATAALKWETCEGVGDLNYQNISLGLNDNIYAGTLYGIVSYTADGEFRWRYGTAKSSTTPAVMPDGTIIFSQRYGPLTAVSPTGEFVWEYMMQGTHGSPVIAPDETIYVGDAYGVLHAVGKDGTVIWTFPTTGDTINTSPAIGADGTVYVYSKDFNVYAVDSGGNQMWVYTTEETDSWTDHSSPAIGADGTIYIGCLDGRFHAINPDGTRRWVYSTGDEIVSSPAIAEDGTVFTGSTDGHLYALNTDGTLKWSFAAGDDVNSAPAVDGAGNVYFSCGNALFYSLSPAGAVRWTYDTDYYYQACNPAIGSDGTVYFVKYYYWDTLMAFGPGE